MLESRFVSVIFFLLLLGFLNYCNSIEIETKLGKLFGDERVSRDGKTYHAFTSIPYAKPPLDKLRFKNPVPADRWEGTLNATKSLPNCIQIPSFIPSSRTTVIGQEDCLYLSVYTPDVSPPEKLPVLVYVHGGGFRCGDVGPRNGPDYFMDENVILVNLNYRLAALGFLSTENSVIPGNFGLKDQAMAIKWISDNIGAFGGDSEMITVFGESAGGASTHYLAMSPLSKDLIKGFISESGTVNKYWTFAAAGSARPYAMEVARKMGCSARSDEEILKCLQEVEALDLVNVELEFLFWDFEPAVVFRPVQEPAGDGAFIPFNPLEKTTTLPWITGIVSNEGLLKLGSLVAQDDSVTQQFIDNIDELLPRMLFLNNSCPKVKETAKIIKEKYFPEPITVKSAQKGLDDIYSDAFFIYPMGEAITRHTGKLYQYYFDYRAGSSLLESFTKNFTFGVSHADELLSLFNWHEKFPKTKPTDEEVSRKLVKMWTNFARKQNPTPSGKPKWPEQTSTQEYLKIQEKFSVKKNLKKDIIKWWSNLPLYRQVTTKSEL